MILFINCSIKNGLLLAKNRPQGVTKSLLKWTEWLLVDKVCIFHILKFTILNSVVNQISKSVIVNFKSSNIVYIWLKNHNENFCLSSSFISLFFAEFKPIFIFFKRTMCNSKMVPNRKKSLKKLFFTILMPKGIKRIQTCLKLLIKCLWNKLKIMMLEKGFYFNFL